MSARPTRRAVLGGAGAAVGMLCLGGCSQGVATPSRGAGTISTKDVPVGGGTIVTNSYYVVTQPTKGVFKAYTRVCPHAGQLVDDVANGAIICPGHGSHFSIADGHLISGPASRGLTEVQCTVEGDTITVTG